jgi:hypothetical protein
MPTNPYMWLGGAILFAVMTIVLGGMLGGIVTGSNCK